MGRFKKGSQEAKEHMAKIRKKRKQAKTVEMGTVTATATEQVTGENTTFVEPISNAPISVTKIEPPVTETLEAEERRLAEELQDGMPTKKEMTECPPGTIHKHLNWEKKNKPKIMRWKTIRRQLYPADTNTANLENIRTKGGD